MYCQPEKLDGGFCSKRSKTSSNQGFLASVFATPEKRRKSLSNVVVNFAETLAVLYGAKGIETKASNNR